VYAVVDDDKLAKDRAMEQELERRFDEIQAALLEQRQYTEFAFDELSAEMRQGFGQVDKRFDQVDKRFGQIDKRFDRLERKLDQFIDTQSRANALIERRLKLLERESPERS